MQFLIWILVGVIAGCLTGLIVKGRSYGILGDRGLTRQIGRRLVVSA